MKKSFKDKFLNALKCFKEDKDELDVNIKDMSLKYNRLVVLYYKYYDNYKVYRFNFDNRFEALSESISCCEEFYNLDEIRDYCKQHFNLMPTFKSVLSTDYVYVSKSGIMCSESDLRSLSEKISDNVFYIMFSNDCLDCVEFVNKQITCSEYEYLGQRYTVLNKHRWSYALIDDRIKDGALVVFLKGQKPYIEVESISNRILTQPKELYSDLVGYCSQNNLYLTHCGDLGIQIAIK